MNCEADFVRKIKSFIYENKLLDKGDRVMVCLSGGADSVCLLRVLCALKDELSLTIFAAHVNHMLRGDESDSDEAFCRNLCKKFGIELSVLRCDVAGEAKRAKESVEAAARRVRYDYFARLKSELKIDKIATAHNKNDNAETSLMHYIRGSGLDGLKGIVPKRADGIVRPVLCAGRDEIEAYLTDIGQQYVTDSTNLCDEYARNKVRLRLLPYLAEEYNPNIINTIADNSLILGLDAQYINAQADKAYNMIANENDERVCMNVYEYKKLDGAIALRVIKKAIASLKGTDKDISYDTVMRCAALFDEAEHKSVSISNTLFARREYDKVYFEKKTGETEGYCYKVSVGDKIYIKEADVTFCLTLEEKCSPSKKNCEYFDYNLCGGQIYIRSRKNGDRFMPCAMKGTKKLKDFFIDEKIGADVRAKIPLVVCEDEILWVSGIRRSNLYRVSSETKSVLKIEFWEGK